jgi:hypothetical protein
MQQFLDLGLMSDADFPLILMSKIFTGGGFDRFEPHSTIRIDKVAAAAGR